LREEDQLAGFEAVVLPHWDAAFNLARWLTRNNHDAEDVVQEAYLRAQKFFSSFHGTNGRAWLLTIVRNTAYTWLERNRPPETMMMFDEAIHSGGAIGKDVGKLVAQQEANELLQRAVEDLPTEFRDIIVLRELEGLSYKEIAGIVGIPLGTVMSRLARARERLQHTLAQHMSEEPYT
jgi:RNA polymerase sigma-70 factor (ECF subfamily)